MGEEHLDRLEKIYKEGREQYAYWSGFITAIGLVLFIVVILDLLGIIGE